MATGRRGDGWARPSRHGNRWPPPPPPPSAQCPCQPRRLRPLSRILANYRVLPFFIFVPSCTRPPTRDAGDSLESPHAILQKNRWHRRARHLKKTATNCPAAAGRNTKAAHPLTHTHTHSHFTHFTHFTHLNTVCDTPPGRPHNQMTVADCFSSILSTMPGIPGMAIR